MIYTSGTTTSRRGWDRLVALVESGQAPFTHLYIKDRTRLGRWSDPREHFYWEVHLQKRGVQICYSELEHQPDYSSDAPDQAVIGHFIKASVDSVVSSEERKRLIRRITGATRQRVMHGFFPGARAPYGTERWLADERTGELIELIPSGTRLRRDGCSYRLKVSDDERVETVRRIFGWVEEGVSLAGIATRLNGSGAPPPGPGPWSAEAVRRIARNPIYCGDLIWGRGTREGDPVEHTTAQIINAEPAIRFRDFLPDAPISRVQYEMVQRILNGNRSHWTKRRATAPQYALSGLIKCAHCEAAWRGFTSTRQEKKRRRYYRHERRRGPKRNQAPCPADNRYMRAQELEDAVLASVLDTLEDDRLVRLVEEAIGERRAQAGSAERERMIRKAEARLRKKTEALDRAVYAQMSAEGDAERASYRRVAEGLSREVDHLRLQIAEMSAERDRLDRLEGQIASVAERARQLKQAFSQATDIRRKEVVATLIHRIVVDPEADHVLLEVRAL